jgi:plasmid replication initiation protein
MEKKQPKKMLIEKRNVLNEMRSSHFTLQESRFFCIYLAKINPRDPEATRRVRFPLRDFAQIMDITGTFNSTYIKNVTDSLLQKIVSVPTGRGGYSSFQLFKKFTVDREDDYSEWYIEIDAHDDSLPLMFDIQDRYMTYELWNVLILKSVNQIRMYEILKQYERLGERTLKLEDLKELLGIDKKEYPQFERFRVKVLNACQQALKEYTDIKFEWEVSKRGQRGKILEIKFFIYQNDEYRDISNLDFYLRNYAYKPAEPPCYEPTEQPSLEMEQQPVETEQPLLPQSKSKKQNQLKLNFEPKTSLNFEPLEKIKPQEIKYAKEHKLWMYAIQIANNRRNVDSPIPYATRIILEWDELGYENKNDIIKGGEMKGHVTSYDLSDVYELFE